MSARLRNQRVLAGLIGLLLAQGAGALEIYRIGGLPDTVAAREGIVVHHLPWGPGQLQEGLDEPALKAGRLRPLWLRPEDNIAPTSWGRGGHAYTYTWAFGDPIVTPGSQALIDADPGTFFEWEVNSQEAAFISTKYLQNRRLTLDLGKAFYLDRVRLIALHDRYPDRLDVFTNAEDQVRSDPGYALANEVAFRLGENSQDTIDVRFPLVLARNVDLQIYRITPKVVQIAEVEVYGAGYITQATYVSPFIDLGEPAVWGSIRWQGRKDSPARVWIRSRSGQDSDPNVYWRYVQQGADISFLDEEGRPLDATSYARLPAGQAAGITYDIDNWSFWTAPYSFADSSGTPELSPALHSILQLRVDFLSALREGGEVEFIEFAATRPPLAEEVVGEIYPSEVKLGETVCFTYAIRPTIRAQHSGFDRVEIAAPFGLVGVDTVKVSGVPVAARVQIDGPDSTRFSVQLPRPLHTGDTGEWIEVLFRAPVLRYSTPFKGWVRDTTRPLEMAQPITPGNAIARLPSETLIVRTTFSPRLLGEVRVTPPVATPNGDGINEEIIFSFNLLQLTDPALLKLEIYDLAGRRCRLLQAGKEPSGRFRFSWDGRDEQGKVMLPGLYLYRVSVEAENGGDQQTGTIAVAY